MQPTISVVIPARDAADTIGQQLAALADQEVDGDWEVIVADNGSTDGTADVARSFADRLPGLRVVDASERVGVNAARNVGISRARGEHILICDADDVVAPCWIEAMSHALRTWDLAGGQLDEHRLNMGTTRLIRSPYRPGMLPVAGEYKPYAVGCNLAVRRSVWEALGGFDESWVGGGDEIEFCWRAQLRGYGIGFAEGAVVAYRYRTDVRATLRQISRSAQAQARLFCEFRSEGMPRRSPRAGAKGWVWLLVSVSDLRRGEHLRAAWLRRLAERYGFVRGSIKHRVLYL